MFFPIAFVSDGYVGLESRLLEHTGWPQWALRTITIMLVIIIMINFTDMLGAQYIKFQNKGEVADSTAPAATAKFRMFQLQYLSVYLIVMLADWLQGPNMFNLYTSYGVDVGTLFITGFAASAIFGTFIGVYVDRWGRRFGCILFCVLEIIINLMEHVPSMPTLLVGRILGGISTSLLFTAFESWMVSQHRRNKFPEPLLASTFAISSWGNGIMGCSAGVVAQIAADVAGDIGPFQVAIALTVLAMVIVFSWDENFGGEAVATQPTLVKSAPETFTRNKRGRSASRKRSSSSASGGRSRSRSRASRKNSADDPVAPLAQATKATVAELPSITKDLMAATKLCLSDHRMLRLGLSQAVFEGGMYTFVFMWVKVLQRTLGKSVPVGLVMVSFMLAMSSGGLFFSMILPHFPFGVDGLAVLTYAVAAMSMIVPVLSFKFEHVLGAFLVFECMVGLFNSCGAIQRSRCYPEAHQSSIMNVFRVPLNLLVVLGTYLSDWADDEAGLKKVFCVLCCYHLLAMGLHISIMTGGEGRATTTTTTTTTTPDAGDGTGLKSKTTNAKAPRSKSKAKRS